jgi:hypothetical protein
MAKQLNRGTKKKIEASATGCEVLTATVTTWENLPTEPYRGQCAEVRVGTLKALGFEQADNALEALAVQLETAARKIRALKAAGGRSMYDRQGNPITVTVPE